jgi:hypothetical protein
MAIKLAEVLAGKPVFINVGVHEFGDSLREAGFIVVQVDWSPPAGGNADMAALLDDLL